VRILALSAVLAALSTSAFAQCPSVSSACPSPTYNNLTVGGTLTGGGVTATGGLSARPLSAWFGDTVNALGQNVTGNGSTGDAAALLAAATLAESTGNTLVIPTPAASYLLGSTVTVPSGNIESIISPGYLVSGSGKLDFSNSIPYQETPNFSYNLLSMTYGAATNGYINVFQSANVAIQNGTTAATVAVFGEGISNVPTSGNNAAWGGNFVGVANATGATTWATENDCDFLASGATCFGQYLAAAGSFSGGVALQIQGNNANAHWSYGILFSAGSYEAVSGPLLYINGSHESATKFVDFTQGVATADELDFPSFQVQSTNTSAVTRLSIKGGVSTGDLSSSSVQVIPAVGTTTTVGDLTFGSLGAGHTYFTSGATIGANLNFDIRDTGGTTVNHWYLQGSSTGNQMLLGASGTDSAVTMSIRPQGAGSVIFQNGDGIMAVLTAVTASSNSYPQLGAAVAGSSPVSLSVAGTSNNLLLGSGSALALSATTGFILHPTTAGIPTGTVGAAGQSAIVVNTSSHKICHSEGGGTWYDAEGAACS
jgi:hypothetical protein